MNLTDNVTIPDVNDDASHHIKVIKQLYIAVASLIAITGLLWALNYAVAHYHLIRLRRSRIIALADNSKPPRQNAYRVSSTPDFQTDSKYGGLFVFGMGRNQQEA